MRAIEELKAVVALPRDPKGVKWADPVWQVISDGLGTRLPADFLKFHEVYGLGTFNSLSHPKSAYAHVFGGVHDQSLVTTIARTLSDLRATKERRPNSISQPLYWEPGGLLPWGRAGDQTYLCWAVSGQLVDDWPVVAARPAKARSEVYEMCMAEFLARLFRGELRSELMPVGLPGKRGMEFERSRFDNYLTERARS